MVFGHIWCDGERPIDCIERIPCATSLNLGGGKESKGDVVLRVRVNGGKDDLRRLVKSLGPQQQLGRMARIEKIAGRNRDCAQGERHGFPFFSQGEFRRRYTTQH